MFCKNILGKKDILKKLYHIIRILQRMNGFSIVPPIFLMKKKQTLYVFEKCYYFTWILRQICYDLPIWKCQVHNRAILWSSAIGKKRIKNARGEWIIFSILKYEGKIKKPKTTSSDTNICSFRISYILRGSFSTLTSSALFGNFQLSCRLAIEVWKSCWINLDKAN